MAPAVRFGLTLPNRMVVVGRQTMEEILALGVEAERLGVFQSLWVGDSLLAKRRPESVVLLAALAGRTRRVRLGVGCMASFALRNPLILAAQWATLDAIAGPGRLILAACLGGRLAGGDWEMEERAFGIPHGQRLGRLVEGIEALKALWTQERASYSGTYYRFEDVRSEPRPVTLPHPAIWIANNPRPRNGDVDAIRKAARRVARLADGWMTTRVTPEEFAERWQAIIAAVADEGKDPSGFDNTLYYNVHIHEDREAAYAESKRFLDVYYDADFPREVVDLWTAYGSPQEVSERIAAFAEAGVREITIRLTAWDQRRQLERLVDEVLPAFRPAGA